MIDRIPKDTFSRDIKLRRANRIRSIHSSLAIEGNNLSLKKVTDVINDKDVIGSSREIHEVKNAVTAYDLIDSLDPYSLDDILIAHRVMMNDLVDESGRFRDCSVGVFKGPVPVHIAPEPEDVPGLMQDLIEWAQDEECHALIRGCVFHCRFEFIHPFVDGNGRIGRLLHTVILSEWNYLFAYLPIETWMKSNQREYYSVLNESDKGDLTEFIRFMLRMIKMAVDELVDELEYSASKIISDKEKAVLDLISKNPKITVTLIAENINVSERTVKRYLSSLADKGIVRRVGSDKTGHWEIV